MLRADFHIHSLYSRDCRTTLEQIIQKCQQKRINCIAISDHGSIEGAMKMQDLAPFCVLVAEEILTNDGEIMGMFLTKQIPNGLSLEESILRIKAQDGLVCLQHPFDKYRSDALKAEVVNRIIKQIDVVETFNSRTLFLRYSIQAKSLALEHNLPVCAGSDAHAVGEIGNAYVEMPEFKGKDDFLRALAQGKIYGKRTNPLISRFNSSWARIKKN
jgi:predicted metal-dependent phosphoesterase TrpH